MEQKSIEHIVRQRNAKLALSRVVGRRLPISTPINLGPASAALVKSIEKALDAGMRNHRAR
jgi:hypothetical protein